MSIIPSESGILIPIKFKDLKITTCTIVHIIQGTIDIISAFHLLPITKMNLTHHRDVIKCKLPLCEKKGAILSMLIVNFFNLYTIIKKIKLID